MCKLRDCEQPVYRKHLCFEDWLFVRRNKRVREPGPAVANVNRLPVMRHP